MSQENGECWDLQEIKGTEVATVSQSVTKIQRQVYSWLQDSMGHSKSRKKCNRNGNFRTGPIQLAYSLCLIQAGRSLILLIIYHQGLVLAWKGVLRKDYWGAVKQMTPSQIIVGPRWRPMLCWRELYSLFSLCSAFFLSDLLSLEISRQLCFWILLNTALQVVRSCYSKKLSWQLIFMFSSRQFSK